MSVKTLLKYLKTQRTTCRLTIEYKSWKHMKLSQIIDGINHIKKLKEIAVDGQKKMEKF